MRYVIRHETEYRYSQPVTIHHGLLHLRPREAQSQHCVEARLDLSPKPASMVERTDYFGNPLTCYSVHQPHNTMLIALNAVIDVNGDEPLIDGVSQPWERVRDDLRSDRGEAGLDAYQYTFDSGLSAGNEALRPYVLKSFSPGKPIFESARDLTQRIHREFKFDPTTTNVTTPVMQVFEQRSGVCQDFAHLMIACLRTLGLPVRYVSGYLRTEPPPGQPRLEGVDASHAWASVYSPDRGWADFDPTNNKVVGPDHVTVAWGRDYDDVAPVKGLILGGGTHELSVRVDVRPVSG